MNRSELIQALADRLDLPVEDARLLVDTFFDKIRTTLMEGGRVELRGFGTIAMRQYGSFLSRNPRTLEPVVVPPKRVPFFRAGKELTEILNTP